MERRHLSRDLNAATGRGRCLVWRLADPVVLGQCVRKAAGIAFHRRRWPREHGLQPAW